MIKATVTMLGTIGLPLMFKFVNCVGKDSVMTIFAFLAICINDLILGLTSSSLVVFLCKLTFYLKLFMIN